ncbi:MAG: type II secretion system F family protein [Verrucomicrobiae bacterium]|nr:type II secretion system F family protein [Verrucomicrobiae bacterium]
MPKFNYTAFDSKGKEFTGTIEATTQQEAIARVREKGLFPSQVVDAAKLKENKRTRGPEPALAIPAPGTKPKRKLSEIEIPFLTPQTVKSKVLTAFTRQLATLIDAGLPLVRGLNVLYKQERNLVLKRTIQRLIEAVEGGSTFSEALASHPKIFNRLYVSMVRAGEAGGVLDVTLLRLADFQEKAQKIKNKVISAMVYPVVVMVVAVAILAFLMTYIVPKFQEIFKDLLEGKELPALTLFVMGVSRMVKDQFLMVFSFLVALFIFIKLLGKLEKGRYLLDALKLKTPLFGQLITKVAIARFSRTLGTLISSGVPILQALNIVKETTGNAVISRAITRIHDSVKEGERVTQPMEASGVFPPMVCGMVDVGEETGALPDMLMKVADVYDDEVDNAVTALTSLLEPIMIVFLAVVVGTIVIAMFLPLITVIQTMSGPQVQ